MKTSFISAIALIIFISSCQKEPIQPNNLSLELQNAKSGTNTSTGLKYGTMKDIDGNIYKTIQIGKQVWMAENLRVTKYRNGNPISNVTDDGIWSNLISGAWCYYNNDPTLNQSYGKLYNWHAVNDIRGLAPKGWHVPTASELNSLFEYLGGASIAGGKMKETGTFFWTETNADVTNSSGFTARPGGYRVNNGYFSDIRNNGLFWTSSTSSEGAGAIYLLSHWRLECFSGQALQQQGLSVRCIKD